VETTIKVSPTDQTCSDLSMWDVSIIVAFGDVGSNPTISTDCCSLTYKEKQIMETLSFVLGIALVVVIALAIVATYAFVKVIKVQKTTEELMRETDRRFADVYQSIAEENRQIHSKVDIFERDVYSQLDSRLDKLETKLTNKK